MSTALATLPGLDKVMEAALIEGDLKNLNPEGRVSFYKAVCSSLGLNPLTKPFAYIVLNGKLTLYALRDCTEQLRKIHGVSITNLDPKMIGDLFVVVASARDGKGRIDSSTGAVNVLGLKGENLANAMMKCETKAKRRVTLSLCGLGLLDETEIETLRQQGIAHSTEESTVSAMPELSAPTAQPAQFIPPVDPGSFNLVANNLLNCIILGNEEKTTAQGKAYLKTTFNGEITTLTDPPRNGNFAFCYDTELFDALKGAVEKPCQLKLDRQGKFIKIEDVYYIAGAEYAEGKPVPAGAIK
jgi:hypothetical protein